MERVTGIDGGGASPRQAPSDAGGGATVHKIPTTAPWARGKESKKEATANAKCVLLFGRGDF